MSRAAGLPGPVDALGLALQTRLMTPNQRHAREAKSSETKIGEVAEALAARWTAATVPVPFDAPAPDQLGDGASPVPRATVCYRHAAALPTTTAGLSQGETSRAVEQAIELMRASGWQVQTQRAVITIIGIPST